MTAGLLWNLMERDRTTCESRDLLANPRSAIAIFWVPAIAMIVVGSSRFSGEWRTFVWTIALAVMGIGCAVNAKRCGRIHCYITGPFFLALAFLTLLYGVGVAQLGRHGWNLVGLAAVIGAMTFCCLPEVIFGKYRRARGDHRKQVG